MVNKHKVLAMLGKRVRSLRQQQGLTQEQLGEKASLDPTYISGIERGVRNPSLLILSRLARALQVQLTDLVISIEP